jgi:hypothetical protein
MMVSSSPAVSNDVTFRSSGFNFDMEILFEKMSSRTVRSIWDMSS